ncbi:MAG: transglutaminase-like cysteine peptidase [Rhodospirillaceae bacterium]|nr:transglutaminase-like cysteine peptidase [Rhodospirillaceae bacterium]
MTGLPKIFRGVGFLAVLAMMMMSVSGSLYAAADAAPSFFNSQETASTNLKPFKKWTEALKRYSEEINVQKAGACVGTKINKCYYDQWMKYLSKLKGQEPMAIIEAINTRMNKAKYITDNNNWGQKDYWASPGEFMARFGDCEDYAIIKFLSLKALGFKEDQLRVVAVKDLNLKVGHAILVVFLNGKTYVLDNQIKQVVEAQTIRHYQPVFSISFKTWWRHRI